MTFIPGAYFANAYNTRDQVNRDLHDGLARVSEIMGGGFRPKSVIAGFLAAANQKFLAEEEGIHVCQGSIWSQYAIDNQDGDGSVCYPYYPSTEHFGKPAQGAGDFIDSVCLDGWTCDFIGRPARGAWIGASNRNSRMGVGPIETIGWFGPEVGLAQMVETTAAHFDAGFKLNGWAWVTNCWEISLVPQIKHLDVLTRWAARIRERWPGAECLTLGDFGSAFRASSSGQRRAGAIASSSGGRGSADPTGSSRSDGSWPRSSASPWSATGRRRARSTLSTSPATTSRPANPPTRHGAGA